MRSLMIIALLGVAALAAAAPAQDAFEAEWALFKNTHGKVYSGKAEEFLRKYIYQDNKEKVEKHNEEFKAGKHTYTLALNQFADMLESEFATMNNYRAPASTEDRQVFTASPNADLPATVDWRTKNLVTPVKNQGQCGSCWSFSTTGSLEGQHAKKSGKLVALSEQQLMDCSGSFGNQGCNGGLMDDAFKYIKSVGGVETESAYPYKTAVGSCEFDKSKITASITGFVDVKSGDESALQEAVATVGPISVAIDASHFSFQLYHGGVYYSWLCSPTKLDHGVLVVGYGTESGKDYWLVKNSWGATWGESGYIKMSRNQKNNCGIATSASYPTV